MALPTYLELVNEVMVLLREPSVSSVNENNLSTLVGKFVNEGKQTVEDAYHWNVHYTSLPVATSQGTRNYTITGSGQRFKVLSVWNTTSKIEMTPLTAEQASWKYYQDTSATGVPCHYSIHGVDAEGDSQVDFDAVPDGVYNIVFNVYVPSSDLSNASDTLQVPKRPVVQYALARSMVERGEDGSLNSSEAYQIYKSFLADAIAIEATRYPDADGWEAV